MLYYSQFGVKKQVIFQSFFNIHNIFPFSRSFVPRYSQMLAQLEKKNKEMDSGCPLFTNPFALSQSISIFRQTSIPDANFFVYPIQCNIMPFTRIL